MVEKKAPAALAALLLFLVLLTAGWELLSGHFFTRAAARRSDWQAAAAAVRAELQPGDLIAIAPAWADPLGRAELGDLMPLSMVGRPDGRAYRRIFELSLFGAHAEDTAGLRAESSRRYGPIELFRYSQTPVVVTYDLVEHFFEAQPSGGPVERRTLEINYRPRYGASLALVPGQKTALAWSSVPDAAWQGSRLVLWLGLHDYYARKNARGPAEVVVDLDDGAARLPLRVELSYPKERELEKHVLRLPQGPGRTHHAIRIEAWAASAPHHYVGVLGRLEKESP